MFTTQQTRCTACVFPREDCSEIQGQTQKLSKLIDLQRKKQICIYLNKTDCHTADNKQEKSDEISNKMTSWREHARPTDILERTIRMSENGDDCELERRFQSSKRVSILV